MDVAGRTAFITGGANGIGLGIARAFARAGAKLVPVHEMSYETWDFALGVNLGGVVNGLQTFVPRMLARARELGGGHVVKEDLRALADLVGVERILFGSDWPHGEGLAQPLDFAKELSGFGDGEVRRVMRENALELLGAS